MLVGLWWRVLRHGGGECERECRSAVRIGQSHSTRINPRNPAFLHFNHHQHAASRRCINRVRGRGDNRMWRCLRWSILGGTDFRSYDQKLPLLVMSRCCMSGVRRGVIPNPDHDSILRSVSGLPLEGILHTAQRFFTPGPFRHHHHLCASPMTTTHRHHIYLSCSSHLPIICTFLHESARICTKMHKNARFCTFSLGLPRATRHHHHT